MKWIYKDFDQSQAEKLAQQCNLSPFQAALLIQRNIRKNEQASRFFETGLSQLTMPELINGLAAGAQAIISALQQQRPISIFCDYDVDGTTSAALLLNFFELLNVPVQYFVPDRMVDGYGLSVASAQKMVTAQNPSLVITVDCGITSVEAVDWLNQQQVETVITDHHLPAEQLPDTPYLINPKLQEGTPFEFLCGCGTAYKLIWQMCRILSNSNKVLPQFRQFLMQKLPLTAIATIADIVPLIDENRVIVTQGLNLINKALKGQLQLDPGIQALFEVSGLIKNSSVTAEDIAFRIAPRLNAAGRLDHASSCINLLKHTQLNESLKLAELLDSQNKERQELCRTTAKEAIALVSEEKESSVTVLANAQWHKGIVGIVAARMVEAYGKPAIILTADGEENWTGSARTIPGLNIKAALDACSHHLIKYGGHTGAAGLTLPKHALDSFIQDFNSYVSQHIPESELTPTLTIDLELSPEMLHIHLAEELNQMEPFGHQNPKPIFCCQHLEIESLRTVGQDGQHLKLSFRTPQDSVGAIAFSQGHLVEQIRPGDLVHAAFHLSINEWKGRRKLDLMIKDLIIE